MSIKLVINLLRPSKIGSARLTAHIAVVCALLIPGFAAIADTLTSTGKMIPDAYAGTESDVGSLPVNIILNETGKYAITTDAGFRQFLCSIDMATGKAVGSISYNGGRHSTIGLYYGLALGTDGTVYAAQGAAGSIAAISFDASTGGLTQTGTFTGSTGDFFAGLATDARGNLYAVDNEYYDSDNEDNPKDMTSPGGLVVFNIASKAQSGRITFPAVSITTTAGPINPTSYPLSVAALADGSKVFVTSERDGVVYVVNATDPSHPALIGQIATGQHPDALLLSPDQKTLYVANASSDSISVVDVAWDKVSKTISLSPKAAHSIPGVSPTGLALSPDSKRLYVSLGDFNAIAIVGLGSGAVMGYLPAGWYPSGIVATKDNRLVFTDAKGTKALNPNATKQGPNGANGTYILNIMEGTTQTVNVPNDTDLPALTHQVFVDNRLENVGKPNELANLGLSSGKITHVIYIIKENRTYDQILGDLGRGNGDPSLALFGKDVTPNQHALANRFVLLDNFYDAGEVSGDGWTWSTNSYANESVIKDLPYNYSGRGRQYDFEGQNNGYLTGGFSVKDPYGIPLSSLFPAGAPAIPDVSQGSNGHIWDDAKAHGLSYRNYGFFYSFGVPGVLPDNYPSAAGLLPAGHDGSGISDYDFRRFDLKYADSDAPNIYYAQTKDADNLYPEKTYGHYNSPSRFAEWRREFDEYLAADPTGAHVPALMMIRFMKDHTSGASSGAHTPRSMVADNDYAVGELIDRVSHSPIWKHTAIFVIEDDAQNGQDHVDAHRSICFVASPFIKQAAIDHRFYNTDSVLKTMEDLLGLPPLSQYDAIASPIRDWTDKPLNSSVYQAILPSESIIAENNPSRDSLKPTDPRRKLAEASDKMDFVHPDSAPVAKLNAIIWKTVKGVNSNPPAPKASKKLASMKGVRRDDDDDGD